MNRLTGSPLAEFVRKSRVGDGAIAQKVTRAGRDTWQAAASKPELRYYSVIAILWSIPVGFSVLSLSQDYVFISTVIAAAASGVVILTRPAGALVALPFFALLSPLAGFFYLSQVSVLLSDLLFVLLAVQTLVLSYKRRAKFNYSFVWVLALVLYLMSTFVGLSVGTLVSWKPLVYLLQLVIVYFYTATLAADEKKWALVIDAWLVATFLGSIVLINAYMAGRPLADFKYGFDPQLMSRESLTYLFQATYYYTGFHYVLGISIVIVFLKLLICESNTTRIFLGAVMSVFLSALIMMMNKTAIFGVLIAISGVLFLSFYVRKKKVMKVFLLLMAFLMIGVVFLFGGVLQFMGESQADLWMRRLFGSSPARLEVYTQALTSWFSYPFQLVTGMGPDFLDGSGDTSISQAFKFSSVTGITEGTVDSGWVSYLIELGFFSFGVLVALFFKSIRGVLRYLKQLDDAKIQESSAIYILGALFFLVVALSSQMLGYTKLTWLPFQLLIIGSMHDFPKEVAVKQSKAPTANERDFYKLLHQPHPVLRSEGVHVND